MCLGFPGVSLHDGGLVFFWFPLEDAKFVLVIGLGSAASSAEAEDGEGGGS